jgi:phosphoribosylformylglycinamidine synthase
VSLLGHPDIASKHWIIRQYDHEVQGNTIVKPLVGPLGIGPGDGSVVEPIAGSGRGIAIACGLQTPMGDPAIGGDPYQMALAAIDECVRNLVSVGADPERIAILDNFCWPSCQKPENLGSLVRAAEGCYDGAKAYRTPFVSGKDSLNNQFTTEDGRTIQIPPTLLITGLGIVPDVGMVQTSDAKRAGSVLMLVGCVSEDRSASLGGSRFAERFGVGEGEGQTDFPVVDLRRGPLAARVIARLVRDRAVRSVHDVSDGGVLVAAAEMLIGAHSDRQETFGPSERIGLELTQGHAAISAHAWAFHEGPSRYLIEVDPMRVDEVVASVQREGLDASQIGAFDRSGALRWAAAGVDLPVERLVAAWRAPLDW